MMIKNMQEKAIKQVREPTNKGRCQSILIYWVALGVNFDMSYVVYPLPFTDKEKELFKIIWLEFDKIILVNTYNT